MQASLSLFSFFSCSSITSFSCFHSNIISSVSLPSLSPLAPFGVCEYIRLHAACLVVKRIQCMSLDDERSWVYDNRNGVNHLSAVGGWVKRRIYWGSLVALFWCDIATYA